MHPIQKQMHGMLLHPEQETKVEYQLKAGRGRVVMVFDDEKRARIAADERGLALFRQTTFNEKL